MKKVVKIVSTLVVGLIVTSMVACSKDGGGQGGGTPVVAAAGTGSGGSGSGAPGTAAPGLLPNSGGEWTIDVIEYIRYNDGSSFDTLNATNLTNDSGQAYTLKYYINGTILEKRRYYADRMESGNKYTLSGSCNLSGSTSDVSCVKITTGQGGAVYQYKNQNLIVIDLAASDTENGEYIARLWGHK